MSIISNNYMAYFPDLSPKTLQAFLSNRRQTDTIPALRLFLTHYKAYPCVLTCRKAESNALFHIPSVLNYLKNQFQHNVINDIILRKYHAKSKQFYAE
jgi:hypothetical protein